MTNYTYRFRCHQPFEGDTFPTKLLILRDNASKATQILNKDGIWEDIDKDFKFRTHDGFTIQTDSASAEAFLEIANRKISDKDHPYFTKSAAITREDEIADLQLRKLKAEVELMEIDVRKNGGFFGAGV